MYMNVKVIALFSRRARI